MADSYSAKDFASLLNLRDDEAQTLKAVVSHCSKIGVATGGAGAVGLAGSGAILVPGIGAVPGWIVGFAAGWAGGTLMCTMAQRGVVIEALKRILGSAGRPTTSDFEAIGILKLELNRLRSPARSVG